MPLQATSGAASYDAFGGGVAAVPNYIEDVFSTYLYTGNGSTQTITNGIDLSGKGGLVWRQGRSAATGGMLIDTARGIGSYLISYSTDAAQTGSNWIDSFNSNGFTMNSSSFNGGATYASWTFRKQPKFFDVVTWSGNGTIGRTISHSLGSEPGCIIVKKTNTTGASDWVVYHRSLGATKAMILNLTDSVYTWSVWNDTAPTSTVFSLNDASEVNGVGNTYVAYLFAHNAGGFGLTGTDNVISCGSYTGNGSTSGPTVTLGYEPQWVMIKRTDSTGNWVMIDSMRGFVNSTTASPSDAYLVANTSAAESTWGDFTGTSNAAIPLATGFQIVTSTATLNANAGTYIYIAIRRGPMKVPTSGTSVFLPTARTGTGTNTTITTGFVNDSVWSSQRSGGYRGVFDRLRGANILLFQNVTSAESTYTDTLTGFDNNTGVNVGVDASWGGINLSGASDITYSFQRAPSFFDVVCYTGTGSDTTQTHNLGVAPELVIIKSRSNAIVWVVGNTAIGFSNYLLLNATDASASGSNVFNSTAPTSTVFSIGAGSGTNQSGATYVAYLFATLAGVSKVGSYTGTGTTKQIDCGFTGGARFVLIKRTDSTGSWYVWDVARGISSGNDPYLLLNSTAAEVTNTDYIDAYSAGFEISSTAPAEINASGGSFIFLAIS